MPKKQRKHKHIPQRTCIGCRETQSKRSLIRVVRSEQGVQVDPTGKQPGRGAYLHDRRSCWEKGMNGSLERALKKELTPEDRERLIAFIGTLPEETSASSIDHEQM